MYKRQGEIHQSLHVVALSCGHQYLSNEKASVENKPDESSFRTQGKHGKLAPLDHQLRACESLISRKTVPIATSGCSNVFITRLPIVICTRMYWKSYGYLETLGGMRGGC